MSRYKEYHQNQIMLMPPSLEDKIPQDHLARYINRLVEGLDIHEIEEGYFDIGCKAYHPRMLLKILIYGYSVGLRSSRRIHRATREDVVFMWLAGQQEPDFRTISDFRKARVKDIKVIFKQVLDICRELEMVNCGKISIDGTKLEANSSRNKLTYRKNLVRRQDKYEEQVDQILKEAAEVDAEEDQLYKDKDGYSMDRKLSDEEIKKAMQKVKLRKEKLQRKCEKVKAKMAVVSDKMERMGEKRNSFGNTDPDATLMLMKEGNLGVGYNVQMATENQVILAYGVYQNRTDVHLLQPMIEAVEANMGNKPEAITVDKGYCSQSNYEYVTNKAILAAIPPQTYDTDIVARHKGTYKYSKNLVYEEMKMKMLDFLETNEGRQLMEKRKNDVEPTFGDIKHNMGFRKFLLRQIPKITIEIGLISIAHNIKKIKNWRGISSRELSLAVV
jgi:transposase